MMADGTDMFGGSSYDRPWNAAGDPIDRAKHTMDAASSFSRNGALIITAFTTAT
jgi:xylose isomerase